MAQHPTSTTGRIVRQIRADICTTCPLRPEGSERWSADQARPCQPDCSIFVNLPRLMDIVQKTDSPSLSPYERAVNELVCQSCQASPTAGDFCADRTTMHCPLALYLRDVVHVIEQRLSA